MASVNFGFHPLRHVAYAIKVGHRGAAKFLNNSCHLLYAVFQ
jgi:hypothetical protein